VLTAADLRRPLPPQWELLVGGDTGTYMSAVFILFPPNDVSPDAFILEEFPNYRYVGGEIELLGGELGSIPSWSREVVQAYRSYMPHKTKMPMWVDVNSQFKHELNNYNITCRGNTLKLELRVEISREYLNNRRVHLAPWLSVLPWELEHAVWPDDTSSAGRFEREKTNDHTLDGVEHVLSRRPKHKSMLREKSETFLVRFQREHRRPELAPRLDRHLGQN